MKRLLCLLLCSILFVACGTTKEAKKKDTAVVEKQKKKEKEAKKLEEQKKKEEAKKLEEQKQLEEQKN